MSLLEYSRWADRRVLEASVRAMAAQFTAAEPVSYWSLGDRLVHLPAAKWIWRQRCQEGSSPGDLDFITYLRQKRN